MSVFGDALAIVLSSDESAALAEVMKRARRVGIEISDDAFSIHLAKHVNRAVPLEAWLSALHAADLSLALGCTLGLPAAMAAFDSEVLSQLGSFLTRLKQPAAFIEDLAQLLREQLYLGAGARPPKLLEYAGRGSLVNWLRVLSMRTAIDLLRKRTEILRDANEILEEVAETGGSDPELAFIRQRCRAHFNAALEQAVASLSDEERMLLRLHFLEGVTLDELAPIVQVHRTTVARRIAAARRQLIEQGRHFLAERLALTPSELQSMVRMMSSRFELSLKGLLAP